MTETKTTRPRIAGLDVVKIIAMLSVVVSHALNVLIAYKQDLPMSTICHSLTAGGVPLFFMVSGYLLFGRNEVTPAYVCRKVYSIITNDTVYFNTLYRIHMPDLLGNSGNITQ